MVTGKNFSKFGESGAICQGFTHPNLYNKISGRLRDEWIPSEWREHVWLKLVTTKSILDSVQSPLQPSLMWPDRFFPFFFVVVKKVWYIISPFCA